MPLQPIATTEKTTAEQTAQRLVSEVAQLAQRIKDIRANGIPAQPAQPARELPDGRSIPGRPAVPGVSAEAIDTALGESNCALFTALGQAIGL